MTSLQIFYIFLSLGVVNCCNNDVSCLSHQKRNPATNKCVDNPPPPPRPAVWLESCYAVPQDCAVYGLDFDISYIFGDTIDCFYGGVAIRCMVKPKPNLITTAVNVFKFLAYNIFERFHYLSVDGQRERTCRIPYWILKECSELDVIAFQEVFIGGCNEDHLNLRDILTYYGFKYFTDVVDSALSLNGGIFIASKWPIVGQASHVFSNVIPLTADVFVAKGVSYAKIAKTVSGVTKIYNVMSTHLQSGGGDDNTVREAQCQEMALFTQALNIPASEPVIYGGDLNLRLDEQSLTTCLNILNSEKPVLSGPQTTSWDPKTNTILKINMANRLEKWIDYIFYSKGHQNPISSNQVIYNAKVNNPFPVCFAEDDIHIFRHSHQPIFDCDYGTEVISDLSDHYPVFGHFVFPIVI